MGAPAFAAPMGMGGGGHLPFITSFAPFVLSSSRISPRSLSFIRSASAEMSFISRSKGSFPIVISPFAVSLGFGGHNATLCLKKYTG